MRTSIGEPLHLLECFLAYPLNRAAFKRSSRVIPPVKAQMRINNAVLVRLHQVGGGRVLQPRQLAGLVCFLIRKKRQIVIVALSLEQVGKPEVVVGG